MFLTRNVGKKERLFMGGQNSAVMKGRTTKVTIMYRGPTKPKSQSEFAEFGQKIMKKRTLLDYSDFDEFKTDIKEIAIIETVEHEGKTDYYCNCFSKRSTSGVKGKVCSHVYALYMR